MELKKEREELSQEISSMRLSVGTLTAEISAFQSQLPTQGCAPTTAVPNRSEKIEKIS